MLPVLKHSVLSWGDFEDASRRIAIAFGDSPKGTLVPVDADAAPLTTRLSNLLGWPLSLTGAPASGQVYLISAIDDPARYAHVKAPAGARRVAWLTTNNDTETIAVAIPGADGVRFPWDNVDDEDRARGAVRTILRLIGEDPDREGLADTPKRVVKSWSEIFGGYTIKPDEVLSTSFSSRYDTMVVLRDIDFHSTCEHHMLPFTGVAHVGYIPGPGRKVVGLSKLARLVEIYARRLQIQEQMTQQVAEALERYMQPTGVGVVVEAVHSCMTCRGVRKQNSRMVTSCLLGVIRNEPSARGEFLDLARHHA
jgi:GTP cyclohydrolase I